ncbi:MAG: HEAT repeat domain-containing protein [Acidimicrobiales bacterium]
MGLAVGGEDDIERLRVVFTDREQPTELRLAAFADLLEADSDPEAAPRLALATLADDSEDPALRSMALGSLKLEVFHSPTFAEWRPAYLDALRAASRSAGEGLRVAAFEVLTAYRDPSSQAALIHGLDGTGDVLVAPEQALRMLADDPHSGVRDLANELVETSTDPATRLEAVRVLSGDTDSVPRLRRLLLDGSELPAIRRMAATALGNLSPDELKQAVDELPPRLDDTGFDLAVEVANAPSSDLDAHISGLLENLE